MTFSIVRPLPNLRFLREVSDWSIVIISTPPNSLTGSRGEYLRVVGIHSDGWIEREISLVDYPFQIRLVIVTKHSSRLKDWDAVTDCKASDWLS